MAALTEPPDPHKWIQSARTERFTFGAWICAVCGYTEFYVCERDRFREVCEKDWYVESG